MSTDFELPFFVFFSMIMFVFLVFSWDLQSIYVQFLVDQFFGGQNLDQVGLEFSSMIGDPLGMN